MKELFLQHKKTLVPFIELFSKFISFINILLLIKILPIEQIGDYSYIIAIVLWASVLMDGGINSLIYNKSLKKEAKGINELYTGRLFLSISITIVIGVFFSFKNIDLVIAALLFSLITYFSSTSALVKMLSRGFGYTNVDLITIITEPVLRLVVLIILYLLKDTISYNLNIVLFWYLISGFIAFLINKQFINIYFDLKLIGLKINKVSKLINSSLIQSKYYLLYYLMYIGLARIDAIFIESTTSKSDLAIFSTAFQLFQVAQLFFFSIITSQFLKIYKHEKKAIKIIFPLTILAVIVTNVLSPYIFKYLFKLEYNSGQFVINNLIYALIPSVINYYFIAKNNYNNNVFANFMIIMFVFVLKVTVYYIMNSSDIIFYSYGVIISEVVLLLSFIIYQYFYANTTNK